MQHVLPTIRRAFARSTLPLYGVERRRPCSSYYGPGGLSAEQLLEAVRKSRAKEQGTDTAAHDPRALSAAELEAMSSKALREALGARSIDCSDCFERSDVLRRARAHLLREDS